MYKDNTTINYIFLISDEIIKIKLNNEIKMLKDYNIKNIIFLNGEYFKIDYLDDIFNNINYKHIYEIDNKKLSYKKITKYKMKIIEKIDLNNISLIDYIKENKKSEKILIHGNSTILKNFNYDNCLVYNKKLNNEEINNIFEELDILENHKDLKEKLEYLNREETFHRIKFIKEIEECINYSQIQYLYCSPKKKKKF